MRVVIAGAGKRRPLDRRRAASRTATRSCSIDRDPDDGPARQRPRRAVAASPTPARSRCWRRPDLASCDVVVAATGDDKVNLVVSLLAKTEFGVPARRRPGQPPQERVDVRRGLGRRRRGVDAAPDDRARRGGRQRRRPGAAVHVPAGRRQPGRADAARGLAATPGSGSATCSGPPTPSLVAIIRDGRVHRAEPGRPARGRRRAAVRHRRPSPRRRCRRCSARTWTDRRLSSGCRADGSRSGRRATAAPGAAPARQQGREREQRPAEQRPWPRPARRPGRAGRAAA